MNLEQRKLLLVGFLEHFKNKIMDTNGKGGLFLVMEDLKDHVDLTKKDFEENY